MFPILCFCFPHLFCLFCLVSSYVFKFAARPGLARAMWATDQLIRGVRSAQGPPRSAVLSPPLQGRPLSGGRKGTRGITYPSQSLRLCQRYAQFVLFALFAFIFTLFALLHGLFLFPSTFNYKVMFVTIYNLPLHFPNRVLYREENLPQQMK